MSASPPADTTWCPGRQMVRDDFMKDVILSVAVTIFCMVGFVNRVS